jgi:hypothetical protein
VNGREAPSKAIECTHIIARIEIGWFGISCIRGDTLLLGLKPIASWKLCENLSLDNDS